MNAATSRYEVVVVGAGQAGLAIGRLLAEQGRRFTILEAADSVGSAWRERWDSLVLFTPRRYDALPGLYFLGLSWQHTRGSALLGFVADDAAYVAAQITGDGRPSPKARDVRASQTAGVTGGF